MNETFEAARPVPRWLHIGAILAVVSTFALLVLGQMVTSFRAGMADPVWPTEPWYLFSNYRFDLGYLIEHSHRIAAYSVGVIITLVCLCLWLNDRSSSRWVAILGLVVLLGGYGAFHGGLIAQRNISAAEVRLPQGSLIVIATGLAILFGAGIVQVLLGIRGAGIRLLGSVALVAVMIQGLLGGFRVMLNELVGTDLAAVHGVFAQIVMGLLVLLAVLTELPSRIRSTEYNARSLGKWAVTLTALLFVQVIWGAMIRHNPTPLTQRLHFLTAFLALALAVLLLRAVFANPSARAQIGLIGWVMAGLLAVQLYLGVEAWMMKFGGYILPELVPITPENATIRTLHALIGSGLLASSLTMAIRLCRTTRTEIETTDPAQSEWTESEVMRIRAVETATRFQGDMR